MTVSGWPSSGIRRPAPICCCSGRSRRGGFGRRPAPNRRPTLAERCDELRRAARRRAGGGVAAAWAYYQGVAGGPVERDAQAWASMFVVPRVLRGIDGLEVSTTIGGIEVATPVLVAPTAGHRMAHPDGELATAAAAAAEGALLVYSSSAAVPVTEFGAGATGPWWAQVYVMRDRGVTDDYVDRCVAAGARALVVTVDYPGAMASPAFRTSTSGRVDGTPGNYPQWSWPEMSAAIDPSLTPDIIGELARRSGLPVHVKGILHPDDAAAAVAAGAAGIVVSNHGRRQVDGVLPTAPRPASRSCRRWRAGPWSLWTAGSAPGSTCCGRSRSAHPASGSAGPSSGDWPRPVPAACAR